MIFNFKYKNKNFFFRKFFFKFFFSYSFSFNRIKFYLQTNCFLEKKLIDVKVFGVSNNAKISKDANIYPNVIFEISEDANLQIGNYFTISYNSLIACRQEIIIGNNVMIGEFTSIRDSTHNYKDKSCIPFCHRQDITAPIKIGNNVWIGRGCIVLPGSIIADNVVIGANSLVKGTLLSNSVYFGSPAKYVRKI
jgi:acetyltransferase-like isoleucine patch superfamily enzyme